MDIKELIEHIEFLKAHLGLLGMAVIIVLAVVEFTPIKINPWSFIKKIVKKLLYAFGDIINQSVIIQIGKVETDVTDLKKELTKLESKVHSIEIKDDERDAINTRNRILAFGDDLMHGVLHSKDSYEQVLQDISKYELYCTEHVDFKNHITVHHAKLIESRYMEHLENNDFLQ